MWSLIVSVFFSIFYQPTHMGTLQPYVKTKHHKNVVSKIRLPTITAKFLSATEAVYHYSSQRGRRLKARKCHKSRALVQSGATKQEQVRHWAPSNSLTFIPIAHVSDGTGTGIWAGPFAAKSPPAGLSHFRTVFEPSFVSFHDLLGPKRRYYRRLTNIYTYHLTTRSVCPALHLFSWNHGAVRPYTRYVFMLVFPHLLFELDVQVPLW